MGEDKNQEIVKLIEHLTGIELSPDEGRFAGRNVWVRVAFRKDGAIHVEVKPTDKSINDRVMATVSGEDMELDQNARQRAYRNRCNEAAKVLNEASTEGMILLVSSNGHLTKAAKSLISALL